VSRLVWVAQVEVRVGEYHLGVRCNDLAIDERLRQLLGDRVVMDPAVRASLAIHRSEITGGDGRSMYSVYSDCNLIFTTRSMERSIAVVLAHLEHHLPRPPHPSHVLEVDAAAIVDDVGAVIVPWQLPYKEPATELRLERHDLRLYEAPSVWIDTQRAELIVPRQRLGITDSRQGRSRDAATQVGPRDLKGWVFLGTDEHVRVGLRPAGALVGALRRTYRHHDLAGNLRALEVLFGHVVPDVVDDLLDAAVIARRRLAT
jgi:hypothetical protein